MGYKYMVLQVEQGGGENKIVREWPFIFPDTINHDDMVDAMKMLLLRGGYRLLNPKAVSAGFCDLDADCHGHSETLKLQSRGPEDSNLINMFPYFHGIKS